MSASILLIGGGDVGVQIADGLLRLGGIRRLVLADIDGARSAPAASLISPWSIIGRDLPTAEVLNCLESTSISWRNWHLQGTQGHHKADWQGYLLHW